ncbi:MAG: (Fe-S)-binding protein [Bacteroidetes bacterium]|nr:MAG: (Fe-S)-binding protein [Bacteroidota bacterium]
MSASAIKKKPERSKTEVSIFIPCFIDQLYPQIGFAMVKVLQKAGCTVRYNPNQTCCGQPAFNAGFRAEAKEVCSKFLKDFEGNDYIVVPSASCAGFIKNYYPDLFDNSYAHLQVQELEQRVVEFSSFLVNVLGVTQLGASFQAKAAYHHSCAALRECAIKTEPLALLQQVAGLELVPITDETVCCGFGGSFAVKFESISAAMADQKVHNITTAGAEMVISTDMSCLMHIDGVAKHQGTGLEAKHIAEVLASGW